VSVSEAKSLIELSDGLLWVRHSVADRARISINLVVIATGCGLITPEVNLVVVLLDELQAE